MVILSSARAAKIALHPPTPMTPRDILPLPDAAILGMPVQLLGLSPASALAQPPVKSPGADPRRRRSRPRTPRSHTRRRRSETRRRRSVVGDQRRSRRRRSENRRRRSASVPPSPSDILADWRDYCYGRARAVLHGLEVTCAEVVLEWLRQGRSRADGVASFEAAVRPGGPKKRRPGMNLWRPCDASWCPSVPPSQSDILFEYGSRAEDVWHNYCYGRARSVLNGLEVTCAEVVLWWTA